MAEQMIVYKRRQTQITPHSSLKRKSNKSNELDECSKKTDPSLEFHTMISDPVLGVQEQVEKLPSNEDNTCLKPVFAAKTECDSSGVVKGNLKQKQGITIRNDQQSFKHQKNIVAYFGSEVDKPLQSELVDVDLTVQASHREEKVPFVSLTSESYGKPIMGYPLEIGEISESLFPSVARKILGDKRSRVHQLVWRKSKRTPVCYVTNSLPAKENSVLTKEESLMRTMKNTSQFNQGKTAPIQTCVPVEVIFRKISSSTILGQHS